MSKPSLLERLAGGAHRGGDIQRSPSPFVVEQSVVGNLRRIFQIRQGSSESAPLCGVPDLSDLFASHSNPQRRLCSKIKAMIEKFEPRLSHVEVAPLEEENPGALRFEIKADLALADGGATPFRVQTVMSRIDHFSVERN